MTERATIAVVGTFDSKGDEHLFLKGAVEQRGLRALTINVGTKHPPTFVPDIDLFQDLMEGLPSSTRSRDRAIAFVLDRAQALVTQLFEKGRIHGILSAGGGTGTHLGASIMRVLPLGIPKVMVSTVASRDMRQIVATKDITMMHSVVDLLGVNSISGTVLDKAAAAACAMVRSNWEPLTDKQRIALTMFGFITEGAEYTKEALEGLGYEVVAFHANGTGGAAMEELAREGAFDGILDLATHELADTLMDGYCSGLGPNRLEPVPGNIPRVVVPGGLDCAVLQFTRENIPEKFQDRKIFFYDFRSAIRLNAEETAFLAAQLAEKLNRDTTNSKILIPMKGWSEADKEAGPLYDPNMRNLFIGTLRQALDPNMEIQEADFHINDRDFALLAATLMDGMMKNAVQRG